MTDDNAIQLISGLLLSADSLAGSNTAAFAKLNQKYPYFLPLRYIKAKEQHDAAPFSKEMLSAAYPYIANWISFSAYLKGNQPSDYTFAVQVDEEQSNEQVYTLPETKEETIIIEENLPAATFTEVEEIAAPEMAAEYTLPEITTPAQPAEIILIEEEVMATPAATAKEEQIFAPVFSEDYFLQQGIRVSGEIPDDVSELSPDELDPRDKALMVMMSFKDWLLHFRQSSEKHKEEQEDKKAVKTMWQKEKLAAAMQEENEEIPENVFEMAVNSITSEEGLASESLAEIHWKQHKYDKAIEMYRKLSLRNPEKNAYFAQKIKDILKEKEL